MRVFCLFFLRQLVTCAVMCEMYISIFVVFAQHMCFIQLILLWQKCWWVMQCFVKFDFLNDMQK